jgi:hypothetical protein
VEPYRLQQEGRLEAIARITSWFPQRPAMRIPLQIGTST